MAGELREALRILRFRQVVSKLGLARSTIYDKLDPKSPRYDPTFPRPITLGSSEKVQAVGFVESELDSWLVRQIEQSRKAALGDDSNASQRSKDAQARVAHRRSQCDAEAKPDA